MKGETWSAEQIAAQMTLAEKRALLKMNPIGWYMASQLRTNGRTLWEMNDFRRHLRGTTPPIQLVVPDVMEPELIRIWQITAEGEEVQDVLRKDPTHES